MKTPVDIFAELGCRLIGFGTEDDSCEAIKRACTDNGWFTPNEIVAAVTAVRDEMLGRERLSAWLERYRLPTAESRNVLAVMAGNIPLVGFFDMMCIVAAGHRCLVKPSSKDAALISYIISVIKEIEPSTGIEIYDGRTGIDAVIVTGGDNAMRHFKTKFSGVKSLLRGNRHSAAVLTGGESARQLEGLSHDIFAYSGLGCRNVSLLFAPQGYDADIPAPLCVNQKYRNNYIQAKAQMRVSGIPCRDLGAALIVENGQPFNPSLSVLSCIRYSDPSEVTAWLVEHDAELQCVVSESIAHPRMVSFGCSQKPGLDDYPDGIDVMEFLAGL